MTERDLSKLVDTTSLHLLQSKKQRKLLDEIDALRGHGLGAFVSLPQLVVCGDQSSGKSSVLEAITEIPFPRKDGLCTRFATEIILRRAPKDGIRVTIIPDRDRSTRSQARLLQFKQRLTSFSALPDIIAKAGREMGIGDSIGAFSKDILSLEISGPTRPQLTLVDLPGLIHAETKQQTQLDIDLVSSLVETYISNERTIILAVVSANNDYANQVILTKARMFDPLGERTLGIITKPDMLNRGSKLEIDFLNLGQNMDVEFKLGWHVLRNRGYDEKNASFESRNETERHFFKQGVWKSFPNNQKGIVALRSRLSELLLTHLETELPKVRLEIENEANSVGDQLRLLGSCCKTVAEGRQLLTTLSLSFRKYGQYAIDGNYDMPFFGTAMDKEMYCRRLRAVVQNLNRDFNTEIRGEYDPDDATQRDERIKWAQGIARASRGRELPGTFNSRLVADLFWDRSTTWDQISRNHISAIFDACGAFIEAVLKDIASDELKERLYTVHLRSKLKEAFDKIQGRLKEVVRDRRSHPITYDPSFANAVAEVDVANKLKRLEQLKTLITTASETTQVLRNGSYRNETIVEQGKLFRLLEETVPSDVDTIVCEGALACMNAYYKVAIKTFVDNISAQIVEKLVEDSLYSTFDTLDVVSWSDDKVRLIASESASQAALRRQLEIKQTVLQRGQAVLANADEYDEYEELELDSDSGHHSVETPGSPINPPVKLPWAKAREALNSEPEATGSDTVPTQSSDGFEAIPLPPSSPAPTLKPTPKPAVTTPKFPKKGKAKSPTEQN